MVSYIPLDNYSIITPHPYLDTFYNLSKTYRINISPNSNFLFNHGFYFHIDKNQNIYIQLDQSLPNFLKIDNIINYTNINTEPIIITNSSSEEYIIEPFSTIFNINYGI